MNAATPFQPSAVPRPDATGYDNQQSSESASRNVVKPSPQSPAMTDTMVIKRRDRRSVHAQAHLEKLPKVPESLVGRVLCAHPEIVTAVACLLLAVLFLLPREILTVATAIGVVSFAFGWARLIRLPAPTATAALVGGVGILAVLAARTFGDFSIVTEIVGLGIVAAFGVEMWRHPRHDLLLSVSGNVAGLLVVSTSGAWIVLEKDAMWFFLLVPAALTLLGGCAGMGISANWSVKARAGTTLAFSMLFGAIAGILIMVWYSVMRENLMIFTGEHLSALPAAIASGVVLGLVIGLMFASLTVMFSADMAPATISAVFSQALIPVLAAGIPVYVLARLLVGEGSVLP